MSLSIGYLTPKQLQIWDYKRTGLQEASIARELQVSRQTIHKALCIAHIKIAESLEETARINKIKIQTVNPMRGYLLGYSPHFKTKTLITFSTQNGIQLWYKHEGDCKNCEQLKECKEALIAEAKERNLEVPEDCLPSEYAEKLFAAITGEKQ
jgi:DNA-binding CsgD family transcriptional regulator